jgi:hypothetical protein
MADDHAQVPQRVKKTAQEVLFSRADATAEQHEQVDVGLQTEMATAVATERQYHDLVIRCSDIGEQLPQHRIDAIGVPLERATTAGASQRLRFEFGASGIERRHECRSAGARLYE